MRRAAAETRAEARKLTSELKALQKQLSAAQIAEVRAATRAERRLRRGEIREFRRQIAEKRRLVRSLSRETRMAAAEARRAGAAGGAIGITRGGLGRILGGTTALFLVYRLISRMISSIIQKMKEWLAIGLKMNALFEVMKIGVAATLAQNAKITDELGRQLLGLEGVVAAQAVSLDLQRKIVAAAFESGSSLDNFLDAFRIALPLALQMGNSVEDTVDVTKRLVLAATAIGVPFELVRLQIDDILRGLITTRTTLARVLGLTQNELRAARQAGTIIDLVRRKTQAFLEAQELIANTFALTMQRAKLLGQIILRDIAGDAFGKLKAAVQAVLRDVTHIDKTTGDLVINPEVLRALKQIGEVVSATLQAFLDWIPPILIVTGLLAKVFRQLQGIFFAISGIVKISMAGFGVGELFKERKLEEAMEDFRRAGRAFTTDLVSIDKVVGVFGSTIRKALGAMRSFTGAAPEFMSVLEARAIRVDFQKVRGQLDQLRARGFTDEELLVRRETLLRAVFGVTPEEATKLLTRAVDVINEAAVKAQTELLPLKRARAVIRAGRLSREEVFSRFGAFLRNLGIPLDSDFEVIKRRLDERISELEEVTGFKIDIQARREEPSVLIAQRRVKLEELLAEKTALIADAEFRIVQIKTDAAALSKEDVFRNIESLNLLKSRLQVEKAAARRDAQEDIVGFAEGEVRLREEARLKRLIGELNKQDLRDSAFKLQSAEDLVKEIEKAKRELEEIEDLQRSAVGFEALERAVKSVAGAQKALALIRARATQDDVLELAQAEARLTIAQAQLRVAQALKKLDDARRGVGFAEAREARASVTKDTRDDEEALKALIKARIALLGAENSLLLARADLADRTAKAERDILDALNEQFRRGGALKRAVGGFLEVIQDFAQGLPKQLVRMAAVVETLRQVLGDLFETLGEILTKAGTGSEELAKLDTLGKRIKEIFSSFEKFKKGIGPLIVQLVKAALAITAAFREGVAAGIGAVLQLVGGIVGGPVGKAIGAAGEVLQLVSGVFTKGARRVAKEVGKAVNRVLIAFQEGNVKLKDTIARLEAERARAVRELSGKKGGQKQLDALLPEIDQRLAQLRRQAKDIIDSFNRDLDSLRLPEALREAGDAIQVLNQRVRDFLDAGGDALRAQEFVARTLQDIYRDTARQLRDDETEIIGLLQREIELQKQKEEVISRAAERERAVKMRLGVGPLLTPSQRASVEIREIRRQRDEELARLEKEQEALDAELSGRRELFGIEQETNVLHERRLELLRLESEERATQIEQLLRFLRLNSQAFSAAFSQFPASQAPLGLPSFQGSVFRAGGQVVFHIGPVTLELDENMSPAQAWELFKGAMKYGETHGDALEATV
jgi:hypothetical protein